MKHGAVTNWRKNLSVALCSSWFSQWPLTVSLTFTGAWSSERRWDGNNRFSDNGIFKVSAAHVNIFVIGLICIHFFVFLSQFKKKFGKHLLGDETKRSMKIVVYWIALRMRKIWLTSVHDVNAAVLWSAMGKDADLKEFNCHVLIPHWLAV